jgi:hypothetical protein
VKDLGAWSGNTILFAKQLDQKDPLKAMLSVEMPEKAGMHCGPRLAALPK